MNENGQYVCELCGCTSYSSCYFEAHHMIPLYLGGIDNIYNTVCLCALCHKGIHHKQVTASQEKMLFGKIREHILNEDIEYLLFFDNMLNPNSINEEYYEKNKEIEDKKFQINWCKKQ